MNDISEVQREFLSVVSEEKFQKEVTKYQSISFSTDSMQYQYKGFQINTMWGYYADKGRGMCLVFNQEEVLKQFKKIKSSYKKHSKVQYNGLGTFYPDCDYKNEVVKYIKKHREEIFFSKSKFWEYENEYRIITKNKEDIFIDISNALVGVIICLPTIENYKESIEYKTIKKLSPRTNIFRYKLSNGEFVLFHDEGIVYPDYPIVAL